MWLKVPWPESADGGGGSGMLEAERKEEEFLAATAAKHQGLRDAVLRASELTISMFTWHKIKDQKL